MRKLFKKSLAICLVAALSLTLFVGTVFANTEDSLSGTITAGTVNVEFGVTEVTVPVTVESAAINTAKIAVSSDFGAVTAIATETAACKTIEDINGGTFLVEAKDNVAGFTSAVINVTFTAEAAPAAGEYAVNIELVEVHAANWDEIVVNLTPEAGKIVVAEEPECDHTPAEAVKENVVDATCGADGSYDSVVKCAICSEEISRTNITVPATGEHAYLYTSNNDGTHVKDCTACENYDAATESCTLGEDNICDYCEYQPVTEPECDHADAVSEVTTRPTKDTEGVRTFTCECGETWTKKIPVATLKTEAADGVTYRVGINLALNSSIEIGFRARKAFIDDAVSYYAIFRNDVYDKNGNVVGETVLTKEQEDFSVGLDNNQRYDVFYDGLTAMEMGTVVTGDIYRELADGSFDYVTADYSIAYYASVSLGVVSDKFDTLLIDMLNYGAAVQTTYSYNLPNLVTDAYDIFANYADKASTTVGEYENVGSKVNNAGDNRIINSSIQLYLKSSIAVVSAVRNLDKSVYAGDLTNVRAKCVYSNYAGGPYTEWIPSSEFEVIDGMLYVVFEGLTTIDLDKAVTIEIYDGDTLVSDTVTYSIASHLLNTSSSDTANYDLAVKMVKFCAAADAYF